MKVTLDVLWNGKTEFNESGSIGRNTCSISLLDLDGTKVMVDLGFPNLDRERLLSELASRNVTPEDIQLVLYTHLHPDHMGEPVLFPNALFVYHEAERAKGYLKKYRTMEVNGEYNVLPGGELDRGVAGPLRVLESPIRAIMTPGHTMGSMTILVDIEEETWALAGDAVLSEEDFRAMEPAHISMDKEMARKAMERIGTLADVIVPGHGPTFKV